MGVAQSRKRLICNTRLQAFRQIVQGFVCLVTLQQRTPDLEEPKKNDEAEDDKWRALVSSLPRDSLDWLKEQYMSEQGRQDAINRNLNLPVTAVVLLFGLIGYFVPQFAYRYDDLPDAMVSVLFIFASICMAICSLFLISYIDRILWPRIYGHVTTPGQIANDMRATRDYYDEIGEADPDSLIQTDFENSLMTQYAMHAHRNFWSNTEKSNLLVKARKIIVASSILFAIQSTLFYVNYFRHGKEVCVHCCQREGHIDVKEKLR